MDKFISIKHSFSFVGFLLMMACFVILPIQGYSQTDIVGSLGGEMSVSPMGTASYSIPIEVVPGTCGVQPSLAITYNSASGRGLLGMGWDLAGLSSITRIQRTAYFDNAIGSVNYDLNDRFALDGARLIKLSNGSYMAQNAVYGTEIENFTRVTLNGQPNNPSSMYFTTVTDQGQIIEYGNTSDSKQTMSGKVLSWWVDKITDPDGNYMNFQYYCSNGEIRPTQISYTGNTATGLSTYARVTFQYMLDPCLNKLWVGGQSVNLSHLLSSINIYYGSELVRSYCFGYDHDRSSRLTDIVLKDGAGTEITRTKVSWGDDDATVSLNSIQGLSRYYVFPGDFTGDNIEDLFIYDYSYPSDITTWQVKKGDGEGGYINTTLSDSMTGSIVPGKISVVDFNGDGIDDVGFVFHVSGTDNYTYKKIAFTRAGSATSTLAQNETGIFFLGNFKGMGQTQVLSQRAPQGNNTILVLVGENDSLTVPTSGHIMVTDINGNGKNEVYVCDNNYFEIYEYDETIGDFSMILDQPHWMPYTPSIEALGDFNGDGAQDHAFVLGNTTYMRLSKGNDYTHAYHMTAYDNIPSNSPLLVNDINGDGKDDIIRPVYNSITHKLTLHVFYSRSYSDTIVSCDTIQIRDDRISGTSASMYHFADLNHDGKNELLYYGNITEDPIIVSFPKRHEHDLVTSVTNGFGMTTTLEYGFCNSLTFGFLGVDSKRIHYPLVNNLRQPDGIGGVKETIFSYGEAVFDHERLQFLGFGFHKSSSNGTNTKLEFEYNEDLHHLGLKHSLAYYYMNSQGEPTGYFTDSTYWHNNIYPLYHYETTNTLGYKELSYGRFIPYCSITSTVNRLENIATTNFVWLNAQGRIAQTSTLHRKAKAENGVIPWVSRDSTEYTYTSVNLSNGETAVKPSRVVNWNRRNGYNQMPSDTTTYTYYPSTGRAQTISVSDSDGPVGVASYTYNSLGLPLTETYTPNGMETMTTTYGYDNKGRFKTQETDVLGHTRSATFSNYTGTMTTETDVNNLTTRYQYDALGRITQITRPDNTVHNIDYLWYNGGYFGNAVYYIRETEAGTPETRAYCDIYGRTIHTFCAGQGYSDVVYDSLGRIEEKTYVPYDDPGTAPEDKTWHKYTYDSYNRVTAETCPYTDLSYTYYEAGEATQHNYFVGVDDNLRNTRRVMMYDALGRIVLAEDDGGTIEYSYAYETIIGKTRDKMTISVGNAVTTIVSDLRGNRLVIQDPDAGTVTNTYNALNQLVSRTDANGNETTYCYDIGGRVFRTEYSDGTDSERVEFCYDRAPGKSIGKLSSVEHDGETEREYAYDTLGRIANLTVYDGHTEYEHLYAYDTLGRVQYFTYPDGFRIRTSYNGYGELSAIFDASNDDLIYVVSLRNCFRQPLKCRFGNDAGAQYTYNGYGMLTGIKNGDVTFTGNIVNSLGLNNDPDISYTVGSQYRNLTYTYNNLGFIASRNDASVNQSETYYYDELDRLTSYKVNGINAATFTYYNNGNIETNSRIGTYGYSATKPHAVTSIGNITRPVPPSLCDVTYNLRNRPETLYENGYNVTLDYDASGMRRHTQIINGQTLVKEKTRISDFYEEESTPSRGRRLDYIYAEGRIVAVRVGDGNTGSLYYVLTDHLGSWEKVLDEDKTIVQQTHFDPWGNRMSYAAWNTSQTQTTFTFDRGFTGHEHYDFMHVINANARLYDPTIGRFFSPDPFVQAPDGTQAYNRYSYCMNNPVMYCDPDGEFFWAPVIVGAMVGAFFGGIRADQKGENFLGGMIKGAFVGGLGGTLGGIGGAGLNYAENLFLGVWEGGFTGYVDGLVWGEDAGKSMLYGMASGAVFTTLTSENLKNALKGYGFKTNANVFEDFKAGKYPLKSDSWQQDALDYFEFEGRYTPGKHDNDAWYGAESGIHYSDGAFTSYDDLLCSYSKESFEKTRHLTNTWEQPANSTGFWEIDRWQAEYVGHVDLYRNQGLYPKITTDLKQPINSCIKTMEDYNFLLNEKVFFIPSEFKEKWWYFIYKIPRRY